MRRNALCGAVALVPSMPGDRVRLGGRPGHPSRPPPPLWLIALALVQYGGNLEVAAQKAKTVWLQESEPSTQPTRPNSKFTSLSTTPSVAASSLTVESLYETSPHF
ncbi:unnamed protein product [Haemonchus placei]|uniref:Secreted protein n=1 Tax=Haemonchus placei TaxID=6290 RepID=A0A0N4W7G3_HAEPC|nr:unnamed protein product [Haemonchus placei]